MAKEDTSNQPRPKATAKAKPRGAEKDILEPYAN
jgi:hypothetical protein